MARREDLAGFAFDHHHSAGLRFFALAFLFCLVEAFDIAGEGILRNLLQLAVDGEHNRAARNLRLLFDNIDHVAAGILHDLAFAVDPLRYCSNASSAPSLPITSFI